MMRSNLILIVKVYLTPVAVDLRKTHTYLATSLPLSPLTGRSHKLLTQIPMFIADSFVDGNCILLKSATSENVRSLCKNYPD